MMKLSLKTAFGPLLALLLTSCAQQPERLHKVHAHGNGTEIFSSSAGVRNMVLREASNRVYCAEPAPDATLDEADSVGLSISMFSKGNDSQDDNSDTSEGSLGGRSVNVLLTREIFYRLCELFGNTSLSDDQKVDLFNSTLQSVLQLNENDLGVGSAAETSVTLQNTRSLENSNTSTVSDDISESVDYPQSDNASQDDN